MRPDPASSPALTARHAVDNGGEPILDSLTLAALIELGGDDEPGLLLELVELYLQDATGRVGAMSEALQTGDLDGVARAAHALKSSSANLGAVPFASTCRLLERDARVGADVSRLVRRAETMFAEVVAALTELRENEQ